jgi:NADPH2:quinone reductase
VNSAGTSCAPDELENPMRAVVCRELTGVGGLEYVSDWPEPQAGPGEVVVEVKAAALNFPDLLMIQGLYQERPPLPFVVGTEMSGVVTAVGEGVQHLSVGDRVVSACGRTLAERVVAKAGLVIPAPRALDFPSAAGICITYFTTMHAYRQRAQLRPGETVLVLGAAGGVGTTAVELGKQFGATVIAAAGSDAKLELVRRLGADHVINYSTQDLRERVKDITGGKGVDVVYDPVGGALAEPALRSMAWNGRYLVIGFAGGDIPKIPLNLPLLKGCSIVGVFWGSFVQRERDAQRRNVQELWELFEAGRLKPVVGETHAFAVYAAAFESLATRRAQGKVVLLP